MWHWAWLDSARQSQTGPHVERIPRQRLPSCKFPAEEFARTRLLLLFGNQHLFREPLNNDFSHILMRLKRHRLNVTFIEAPSIGAKFSSLTKPFTPRWDSPRNLNKDFLLSSQKPWRRKNHWEQVSFKAITFKIAPNQGQSQEYYLKLGSGREFTAGELESDLHAAVPDVVVVLHHRGNHGNGDGGEDHGGDFA